MSDQIIKKILEAAILAPSGENSQPWRFEIDNNKISLFNQPKRDQSVYNWGQRASMVAHGAAIENMNITANQFGYDLDIRLFPDQINQPDLVSTIEVKSKENEVGGSDSLYPYLQKRCTNRRPYNVDSNMALAYKQQLEKESSPTTKILLIDDKAKIKELAESASTGEKILFEDRRLHDFFFEHINWTKNEDEKKRLGFYIETLELPPPARIGFKLFKHWSLLNLANKILGVSKVVAKENAKTYSNSSAIGVISVTNKRPEDFIAVGRTLERVWLTATKLGLSFQPVTGILWFHRRLESDEGGWFSLNHQRLIGDAYTKIASIFGIGMKDNQIVAMMFRLGQAQPPSARSLRFPVENFIN